MKYLFLLFAAIMIAFPASAQVPPSGQLAQPVQPDLLEDYPNVRDLAFSPDKKEVYFTVESLKKEFSFIARVSARRSKWSKPEVAVFSGNFKDLEPTFSPDGLKLFFASNRPLNPLDSLPKEDFDIWYVQRENSGADWSEPVNVGLPVNTPENEFYPSVSKAGNLYFTAERQNSLGKEDIFVSPWKNGAYQEPQALPSAINTEKFEFNAYISADEKLLIFSSFGREDDMGSGDLYFSYKDFDNQWTKAESFRPGVNSTSLDYCPFVDFENQLLYFTSERSHVARKFRKKGKLDFYLKHMRQYSNGLGRFYTVELKHSGLPVEIYRKVNPY